MGNRAVITIQEKDENIFENVGIYLHWNGGQNSVRNFLLYARMKYYTHTEDYSIARMCQMIGNFFGGTNSLGVGIVSHMDWSNCDNGVYIIDSKLKLKEQAFYNIDYDKMDKAGNEFSTRNVQELIEKGFVEKQVVKFDGYNSEEDLEFLKAINDSMPKSERLKMSEIKKMYKEFTK